MRLGKDLEGKPIISISDGRIIGRAKDVFVDSELTNLLGLYMGMDGVIRRKTQVISSMDVVLFGIDVVLVKNAEVIVTDKDLPEVKNWLRLKDLQGREVLTPGGTKLGSVGDVILDEIGNIVGLHLARVFVKGPLAEQGSIPREAVVNPQQEDGTIGVDLALLEKMVGELEEESDGSSKEAEAGQDPETEEITVVVEDDDAPVEEENDPQDDSETAAGPEANDEEE